MCSTYETSICLFVLVDIQRWISIIMKWAYRNMTGPFFRNLYEIRDYFNDIGTLFNGANIHHSVFIRSFLSS